MIANAPRGTRLSTSSFTFEAFLRIPVIVTAHSG
jgi:hypothetical protein